TGGNLMIVGVPRETFPEERRVALVPDGVKLLTKAGHTVAVQRGAGQSAGFPDAAYREAGAEVVDTAAGVFHAQVIVKVQRPGPAEAAMIPQGATVVSLLGTGPEAALLPSLLAGRRVTFLALERVPRITRAQSMDVLSSQSTVAGYKAVLIAASTSAKLFPMMTTAAGTLAPSRVFVLGAGVAGLQAIATARRLGAVASAFDVRPAAREQVQSLGATFVAAEVVSETGEVAGGYARAQSDDEQRRTLAAIAEHLPSVDVVIATAQIPGQPAPRLLTAEMLRGMRPGSVIVDLAAETGGNCELTRPGETVQANGVTVVGPVNVAATVPYHASQMLGKNMVTLLQHLIADGALRIDLADEITSAMTLTHDGAVR
ncbi:MAG TPA: Re/Si-specific NAD(P)(+) transhydrogenase subunit alpha, partial [Gemmatimonadaceae bacterium]|nr:Re/Si-specific NAD(P)(+) transhydrogenase subunit alpha [Gemmatimonadaceae bacterium]